MKGMLFLAWIVLAWGLVLYVAARNTVYFLRDRLKGREHGKHV